MHELRQPTDARHEGASSRLTRARRRAHDRASCGKVSGTEDCQPKDCLASPATARGKIDRRRVPGSSGFRCCWAGGGHDVHARWICDASCSGNGRTYREGDHLDARGTRTHSLPVSIGRCGGLVALAPSTLVQGLHRPASAPLPAAITPLIVEPGPALPRWDSGSAREIRDDSTACSGQLPDFLAHAERHQILADGEWTGVALAGLFQKCLLGGARKLGV